MPRCLLRRRLGSVFAGCLLCLSVLAPAELVAAQDETFDANETEGTIDSVRYQLWGIAGVTTMLLVGYVWHTDPQRRRRVAERRRAEEDAVVDRLDTVAFEETFVLPADFEADVRAAVDPDAD